jgi:molybdenum cofactor cytidylyltransferase
MDISAIVMAAGLSKRMNKDKLKMKLIDKFIYEYVLDTIKRFSYFKEVIVVAKDEDILNKAVSLGFKAVKNNISYLGQSESIKLGIINTHSAHGYMFFVADQPFIKYETINKLISLFQKNPHNIIVACCNGVNSNPVIFPVEFKNELLNLKGDVGGKIIIRNNPEKVIKAHIQSEEEFMDIDTIEDYDRIVKKVID